MPRSTCNELEDRGIFKPLRDNKNSQNRTEKSPVNKLKTIESTTQPTLSDGETVLWWDTDDTNMYLLTRRDSTYYKIELT